MINVDIIKLFQGRNNLFKKTLDIGFLSDGKDLDVRISIFEESSKMLLVNIYSYLKANDLEIL